MGRLIDKRILFIHIPKTAGTYLNRNFAGNFEYEWEYPKHLPLCDLYRKAKQEGIDTSKLYTISLVRNPWTKQYSAWSFFKQLENMEYFSGDANIDDDFNKWMQWVYSDKFDRNRMRKGLKLWPYIFNNQLNWFKSDDGKDYKLDKIIKMENLDSELVPLAKELGMKKIFKGRINFQKNKPSYDQVYNQESIDLVAKHFAEDIKTFDYTYQQL